MGIARYIINAEEAIPYLIPTFDENNTRLETGVQRCKGMRLEILGDKNIYEITWKPPSDIRITGLKMAVGEESEWQKDSIDLIIGNDQVFRNVNVKDVYQYKNFRAFRPVKKDEEIKIIYRNRGKVPTNVWFDLDYIGEPVMRYVRILSLDKDGNELQPPWIIHLSTGKHLIVSQLVNSYRVIGDYFQYITITHQDSDTPKEVVFEYQKGLSQLVSSISPTS